MLCPTCGHQLADNAKFCGECGTQLSAVQTTPTSDLAQLEELLRTNKFATVLARIGAEAPFELRAFRAEAQRHFQQTIAALVTLYANWFQSGPPNPALLTALTLEYRDKTPAGNAIYDPVEADAYATALLGRARQMLATGAEADQIRATLYAVRALPDPQRHEPQLMTLLAQVNGAEQAAAPSAPAQPEGTQTVHSSEKLPPEEDQALTALERLEQALNTDKLSNLQTKLTEAGRLIVGPDSPYWPRLEQAKARFEALRKTAPVLTDLFNRPLAEWMDEALDLAGQTGTLLGSIEAVFDSDAPPVVKLRERREKHLKQRSALERQIAGLQRLEGEALVAKVEELENLLPQTPLLADARQRRDEFLTNKANQARLEQGRIEAEAKRRQYSALRLNLDNLYHEPTPDPAVLLTRRNEAASAAADPVLPQADHPLDQAAFAYYDLLFASRYRALTVPNAKVQQGATLANLGDLVGGYRILRDAVAELKLSDDADKRVGAERQLEEVRAKLLKDLTAKVKATLVEVTSLLNRADYQAALQNLAAQRRINEEAEIELGQELRQALDQATREVEEKAQQDRDARTLCTQADETVQQSGAQVFAQAFTLLAEAEAKAPWLKADIERQREQIRERRVQLVTGRIKRAEYEITGGDEQNFKVAESLLQEAEWHHATFSEEQKEQIDRLRSRMRQQRTELEEIAKLRSEILTLAEQAKRGDEIDLLASRITSYREGRPTAELNGYLDLAEQRIKAWRDYRDLCNQANQAATEGKEAQVRQFFAQIIETLGRHSFLPIGQDRRRLLDMASQEELSDRVRSSITSLLKELSEDEGAITAERIHQVLRQAEMISDDTRINEQSRVLRETYLPIYQAHDQLGRTLKDENFDEFDHLYEALAAELKHKPKISTLKDEAKRRQGEQAFKKASETLLSELRPYFDMGWDDSDSLGEAIKRIEAFIKTDSPVQYIRTQPYGQSIDQLKQLNKKLKGARADCKQLRFAEAERKLGAARDSIPTVSTSTDNVLSIYTECLKQLRSVLDEKYRDLQNLIDNRDKADKALRNAVSNFNACIKDPDQAFKKEGLLKIQNSFAEINQELELPAWLSSMLLEVQNKFVQIDSNRADAQNYIDLINKIIMVLELVQDTERLMIHGDQSSHAPADRSLATQPGGHERKALVQAHIAKIRAASDEIQTPQGVRWIGIREENSYKLIEANLELAYALGEAKRWLGFARRLQHQKRSTEELEKLQRDVSLFRETIDGAARSERSDGAARSERSEGINKKLEKVGLSALVEECTRLSNEIRQHLGGIRRRIEENATREKQHQQSWARAMALIVLTGVVLAFLSIAPIREALSGVVLGTPIPEATLPPAASPTLLIVTVTPRPTVTPNPTSIPVAPQTGIVVVPGQANVRSRPSTTAAVVSIVTANDDVVVTGFTDGPDGARWYRLDVVGRNLRDGWLLARVVVQGRTYDTIRLLDGKLRQDLWLTYPQ